MFSKAMTFFSCTALKCVSINNQEGKIRSDILNISKNEPSFYCYFINLNECSGSCNNINHPYADLSVHVVVEDKNISI